MKHLLVLGIVYEYYKSPAIITIRTKNKLIDQLHLYQSHPETTNIRKYLDKDNLAVIDKRLDPNGKFIKDQWTYTYPTYYKTIEIDDEDISDKITIEVDNSNSNYTNGFMTKSSVLKFSMIALIPKWITENKCSKMIQIAMRFLDGHENKFSDLENYHEDLRKRYYWPLTKFYTIEYPSKQEVKHYQEFIGGSFKIKFDVRQKHGLKYLWACDSPLSDRGFWTIDVLHSLIITSVSKLINTYNEDKRSNHT